MEEFFEQFGIVIIEMLFSLGIAEIMFWLFEKVSVMNL